MTTGAAPRNRVWRGKTAGWPGFFRGPTSQQQLGPDWREGFVRQRSTCFHEAKAGAIQERTPTMSKVSKQLQLSFSTPTLPTTVMVIGANGSNGLHGSPGTAGASETLIDAVGGSTNAGDLALGQSATGGSGGSSNGGGAAGAAGLAKSSLTFNDTTNPTQSATLSAQTNATGGAGGSSDTGKTSAGGAATALTSLTGGVAQLTAQATAKGGSGGNGTATASGAAGGAASASTIATGTAPSGSGKLGGGGIANTVATSNATGGNGGNSASGAGGAGGAAAATSTSTFNGTVPSTGSSVWSNVTAIGGNGGASTTGAGGAGGAAYASDTVTGLLLAGTHAFVMAIGGNGGKGTANGAGGAAVAKGSATGTSYAGIQVQALGGSGAGSSGSSTATATGANGDIIANSSAQSANSDIGVVGTATSSLSGNGTIADSATDVAIANFGVAPPTEDVMDQCVANITGQPLAATVTRVLKKNRNIAAANTSSSLYFANAELGGAYSKAGVGSETTTSLVGCDIVSPQATGKYDLEIGLYGGMLVGKGVTKVTLTITAGATQVLNQTFASGAAALAYFTNHALDLGALVSYSTSGLKTSVSVSLDVTTTSAGSGFYGHLLIGTKPTAITPVQVNPFDTHAALLGSTLPSGTLNQDQQPALSGAATLISASALRH